MPIAQREVLSVGIDVGTTTTQVVFSRLVLRDVARPGQVPRIQVDEKAVLSRGDVHPTPLSAPDQVDAQTGKALTAQQASLLGQLLDPAVLSRIRDAELRARETVEHGAPRTPFLKPGDRIRIEMLDAAGTSIFGAIEQEVVSP